MIGFERFFDNVDRDGPRNDETYSVLSLGLYYAFFI